MTLLQGIGAEGSPQTGSRGGPTGARQGAPAASKPAKVDAFVLESWVVNLWIDRHVPGSKREQPRNLFVSGSFYFQS